MVGGLITPLDQRVLQHYGEEVVHHYHRHNTQSF
jgi:hypothetical protein